MSPMFLSRAECGEGRRGEVWQQCFPSRRRITNASVMRKLLMEERTLSRSVQYSIYTCGWIENAQLHCAKLRLYAIAFV